MDEEPAAFFFPRACETTFAAMTTNEGRERGDSRNLPADPPRARVSEGGNAEGTGRPAARPFAPEGDARDRYLRCLLTSFVISNIETWLLPPNTGFRFSSALIWRRFLASWRPFRLM